jgi:hypothetical protein
MIIAFVTFADAVVLAVVPFAMTTPPEVRIVLAAGLGVAAAQLELPAEPELTALPQSVICW